MAAQHGRGKRSNAHADRLGQAAVHKNAGGVLFGAAAVRQLHLDLHMRKVWMCGWKEWAHQDAGSVLVLWPSYSSP
eukprot:364192-Chlamydomonas_euryale.AAC.11